VQAEVLQRSMEIAQKYAAVLIPLGIAKLLVEVALVVGAIMSLLLKAPGRSLLMGALIAAVIIECVMAVPSMMVRRDTQAVMADLMPKILAAQRAPNGPPPGIGDMSRVFSGMGTITMVFSLGWLAVKIILYILGINYLRKPKIVALFS